MAEDGVVEWRNGRTVMTEWRNGKMAGPHEECVYVSEYNIDFMIRKLRNCVCGEAPIGLYYK